MLKYYVELHYSDGSIYDSFEEEGEDGLFDTEDAAEDYANYLESCRHSGAETLHMSNPGDYAPDDPDDEAEIIICEHEIDD
jgi:hypothetical protein